jgi:hypothetical protein
MMLFMRSTYSSQIEAESGKLVVRGLGKGNEEFTVNAYKESVL